MIFRVWGGNREYADGFKRLSDLPHHHPHASPRFLTGHTRYAVRFVCLVFVSLSLRQTGGQIYQHVVYGCFLFFDELFFGFGKEIGDVRTDSTVGVISPSPARFTSSSGRTKYLNQRDRDDFFFAATTSPLHPRRPKLFPQDTLVTPMMHEIGL